MHQGSRRLAAFANCRLRLQPRPGPQSVFVLIMTAWASSSVPVCSYRSQQLVLTHPPVCSLAGHLEEDVEELRRGGVTLSVRHF